MTMPDPILSEYEQSDHLTRLPAGRAPADYDARALGVLSDEGADGGRLPVLIDGVRASEDAAVSGCAEASDDADTDAEEVDAIHPGGEAWYVLLNGALIDVTGSREDAFDSMDLTARVNQAVGRTAFLEVVRADQWRK